MSGRHDHHLTATGRHRGRLWWAAGITATMFVVEVVGALLSGSLALLADAAHMLTDSAGLGIALIASVLAGRPPTKARTYGLQRAEILAALANGVLLVVLAVSVLVGAVQRWNQPAEVSSGLMLGVAIAGLVANLAGLLILRGGHTESLNVRGAYLEMLGDLVGSLAVISAGVVIALTGFVLADSIAAVVIFCLLLPRAWTLIREVLEVLLEATPPGIDLDDVRRHLREVPGVVDVHDLHAWRITSGSPVLSAHVVVDAECIDRGRSGEVLDQLSGCLASHFDLSHSTLQLEPQGHQEHEHPNGHD